MGINHEQGQLQPSRTKATHPEPEVCKRALGMGDKGPRGTQRYERPKCCRSPLVQREEERGKDQDLLSRLETGCMSRY